MERPKPLLQPLHLLNCPITLKKAPEDWRTPRRSRDGHAALALRQFLECGSPYRFPGDSHKSTAVKR